MLGTVPASATGLEGLFPDEGEIGVDVDPNDLLYKQTPGERYVWDTNLKWFEMKGLRPVIGNANAITDNSMATSIFRFSVILTRLCIFVFQFTFNTNMASQGIVEISQEIIDMKDIFYNQFYGLFILVLLGYMVLAYARGNAGLAIRHLLLALILVALIGGLVENIEVIVGTTSNLADSIGGTVLGVVNLSPLGDRPATELAEERLVGTANTLWKMNVVDPWKYGQFGTLEDINMTAAERNELAKEYDIHLLPGNSWAESLLLYHSGSADRKALIEVLGDPEITHDLKFNIDSLGPLNIEIKYALAILSFLMGLAALIFFGIVGSFLMIGSLAMVLLAAFSPIAIPVPLLVGIGHALLRRYIGTFFVCVALVIAASLYLGVVLLTLYIVTLFDFHITLNQIFYIIIFVFGIIFSPKIMTSITPAVVNMGSSVFKNKEFNQTKSSRGSSKSSPQPVAAEDVTEQGKRFGESDGYDSEGTAQTQRPRNDPSSSARIHDWRDSADRPSAAASTSYNESPVDDIPSYNQSSPSQEPPSSEKEEHSKDVESNLASAAARMAAEGLKEREESPLEEKLDRMNEDVSHLKEQLDNTQAEENIKERTYQERPTTAYKNEFDEMPHVKDLG